MFSRNAFIYFLFVIAAAVCIIGATFQSCNQDKNKISDENSLAVADSFVGSATCKTCHAQEFNDWLLSDHYQAMKPANDSSVSGDFNNATFIADGVTTKFFKKAGKFYINTQGDDGKNHDFEVLYTFGFYPLQQYLVSFPGGRMQATRVSWNAREKKWFNQYGGQKIYHHDWLHWTGNSQNWNTMCASCHSTDLKKNYDFVSDSYQTTYHEINVSCESCHGPGNKHLAFVNSADYKNGAHISNSGFHYSNDTTSKLQLQTCAPCHARKAEIAADYIHSDEVMDNLIPQVISNEFYYADGQIKEEDYEYGSFTQSKMFHNNVRCSNCHNPHSGKLKIAGNNLCISCHAPKYDSPTHTFHAVNTEGAKCVNCHMATKDYMGIDHRRDHSLRIPRPDQSVAYNTPNACNNCHQNKTAKWATDAVVKWYGPERAYHFSDDLLPGSLLNEKSEVHLIKLLADTSQPEIARATAAHYLENIGTQKSADALLFGLNDNKAIVRYHALLSLKSFPSQVWMNEAVKCLTDKVRAVRIAAAGLYHTLPQNQIPTTAISAYANADAENKSYLSYQTDFSVGNVMLADYELQSGDHISAIQHYLRGLKKDSLLNYARLNLAATYNSVGKNDEALKTLKEAATIDNKNERVFYNLGLLYYEMGNTNLALENFEKAVKLGSTDEGLFYNYGLLLQQTGKMKLSENVLLKGYSINPNSNKINYALAYFYLQAKMPEKASLFAKVLFANDPQNPEYQVIFKNLHFINQ